MVQKLKTDADWEKFDNTRLTLAMEEVRGSENLRFLFRYLLADLNPLAPMGGDNAAVLGQQIGRHTAGLAVIGTLDAFDDTLWLDLQVEAIKEHRLRSTPDGGNHNDTV